jgi:hypothetical protein
MKRQLKTRPPSDGNQPVAAHSTAAAVNPLVKHLPPQTAYLIGYNVGALRLWRRYVEWLPHLEPGQIVAEGDEGLLASSAHLLREVSRFGDSLPSPLFASFQASASQLDEATQRINANSGPVFFGRWDDHWEAVNDAVTRCIEAVGLKPWCRPGHEVADYQTAFQERSECTERLGRRHLPPLSGIQWAIQELPPDARASLASVDRLLKAKADDPLKLFETSSARKGSLSDAEYYSVTAMFHAIDHFSRRLGHCEFKKGAAGPTRDLLETNVLILLGGLARETRQKGHYDQAGAALALRAVRSMVQMRAGSQPQAESDR